MEDLDDQGEPVLEGSDHDLYDIIEELDEGKHVGIAQSCINRRL